MSEYQVLMRKLRPMTFAEVIGQKHIVETLQNSIKTGRIAHGYLFSGTRGVGKTTVARIFAKALNCEAPINGEPCNKCTNCVAMNSGNLIDVQEIDGASNNKVENIRKIREEVVYPPITAKYKVYIIDEVHMLTTSAFNALLKTLEEPPSHAVFIFATTEIHKVPQTIISRCQHFDFKKISIHDIKTSILNIAKRENFKIDEESALIIAREARGSVRDSLSILELVLSFTNGNITKDAVLEVIGSVDKTTIIDIVESITSQNSADILNKIQTIYENGYDLEKISRYMLEVFRDAIILKVDPDNKNIINSSEDEINRIINIANNNTLEDLQHWFKMTLKLLSEIRFSPVPELIIETGLINMANKPKFTDISTVIEEISKNNKQKKNTNTVVTTTTTVKKEVKKPVLTVQKPTEPKPDYHAEQKKVKNQKLETAYFVQEMDKKLKDYIDEKHITLK